MGIFDEIIEKPAFTRLEPERRAMFAELMGRLEGKDQMEAMVIMGEFMRKIPKGSELSKPERDALFEAALECMPNSERERFRYILKMLESAVKG